MRAAAVVGAGAQGSVADLVGRWRHEAGILRRRGAVPQAEALESCAAELEEAVRAHTLAELTIAQAAAESGYSESQLRRRFPGQPTVRRADLPQKGRTRAGGPNLVATLLAEENITRRQG